MKNSIIHGPFQDTIDYSALIKNEANKETYKDSIMKQNVNPTSHYMVDRPKRKSLQKRKVLYSGKAESGI